MASLMIHQAIGEEYCKKHHINEVERFLCGNLAPDLVKDKSVSHFSSIRLGNRTYTESILNKINLNKSCEHLDINDPFQKGQFLHLFTDFVFFYHYLLNNPKYKQVEDLDQLVIRDTLYRDYHRINKWLMDTKPDIDISSIPLPYKITRDDETEILSKDDIKRMICYCSSIDIDTVYQTINSSQEHTL